MECQCVGVGVSRACTGNPDRYSGFHRGRLPGEFAIRYDDQEKTSFQVRPISNEYEDPSPDLDSLERLATATGGMHLPLANIEELDELIVDASVKEVIGRRAATVWDSAFLMGLFCAFLILEWTLRKIWHLN